MAKTWKDDKRMVSLKKVRHSRKRLTEEEEQVEKALTARRKFTQDDIEEILYEEGQSHE